VREDRIHIQDYEPSWAELFEQQRGIVDQALTGLLTMPVEHIGSTSIPGLPAKPIIDMLAVVDDYDSVTPRLQLLRDAGWTVAPEPGDEAARKYSICFPTVERRTHHLHVVEPSWGWQDLLIYRDYLRAHPDVAQDYAVLKRELAAQDDQDRPRYRAAKAPFIQQTLAAARHWHACLNGPRP
jgi:GrpB-like predicted nucleotidyltransferase (UPF0157 family)